MYIKELPRFIKFDVLLCVSGILLKGVAFLIYSITGANSLFIYLTIFVNALGSCFIIVGMYYIFKECRALKKGLTDEEQERIFRDYLDVLEKPFKRL